MKIFQTLQNNLINFCKTCSLRLNLLVLRFNSNNRESNTNNRE